MHRAVVRSRVHQCNECSDGVLCVCVCVCVCDGVGGNRINQYTARLRYAVFVVKRSYSSLIWLQHTSGVYRFASFLCRRYFVPQDIGADNGDWQSSANQVIDLFANSR